MNIKKLYLSFTLIIIIAVASAFFTIDKMNELSTNTQKMYTHPFKVSNAVSDIQTAIITIHRNMKDVVLTKDSLEMIKIIEAIQHKEDEVLKNYELVYKNYLGDKKDIDKSYISFKAWKKIREEVISLMYQKRIDEAIAITKGKGAKHTEKLYVEIKVLKDYAFTKANEFYSKSVKDNGVDYVVSAIFIAMSLSALIVIYIVITLLKVNRTNHKQLYLIDQNILTAKLSLDKEIIEISNALCRTLNNKKEFILNTTSSYFFTTKEQYALFDTKIYSGKEHTDEVYINVGDKKVWFNLEVFPELDANFNIKYFNLFLTNISDKKKIEEIAIVDSLTGLNNRNYFETIFEKETRRAKRDKKPLSLLMFDIDYFKQYNDAYGHLDGDKALKAVAHVIAKHTNRSYDYSFRIGGEEFIILSYQDTYEKTKDFANMIIHEVEELKINHKSNKISDYLTISCGAIRFDNTHLLTTDQMYKEADDLLYQAKREGRNRYISKTIS